MIHRARSNPRHYSHNRYHWCKSHGKWKEKVGHASEKEATEFILHRHMGPGYVAYECPECGRWHIGFDKTFRIKEENDETSNEGAVCSEYQEF